MPWGSVERNRANNSLIWLEINKEAQRGMRVNKEKVGIDSGRLKVLWKGINKKRSRQLYVRVSKADLQIITNQG